MLKKFPIDIDALKRAIKETLTPEEYKIWEEKCHQDNDAIKNNSNFMQQLAAGQVKEDDIDDDIDDWHKLELLNPMSLHSYLGMTREEYVAWLECRLTPREILDKRNEEK